MKNQPNTFAIFVRDQTKKFILEIAANKGIPVPYDKVVENFNKTQEKRFQLILQAVQEAGKEADLFNSLDNQKIDPLVKKSASITLTHECLKYAYELMELPFEGEKN